MFGPHIPKSASQEPSTPTCSDPGAAAEAILPHTLQHWFLLANLHVWMLSVRLRALDPAHGHSASHIQGLIDHLFMDVEDRIRLVLQPPSTHVEPYTARSTFYPSPTHPLRSRGAPERLVSTQMKVFREQYRGMGVALDYALATNSDHHMAAALWRNILGARGREGLGLSDTASGRSADTAANGEALVESKPSSDATAVPHDPLGAPLPSSSYLSFPPFLLQITAYVRRNLARLDAIEDEAFVHGKHSSRDKKRY
ncbi:hypothetical protein CYLTODRAFT_359220 [Cylindrobasidium torrendii FP15055 ss-10]|uniref:Ubiquinol-cytochrome c chaperone domain-containing protein n=1 Tax=Cylindrobasidium torrendii FP15055 ss-10 TaxID=1314674 RepID=A0A0D7B2Z1_9AGAR|nr:hypothetical protein CYLTODRAFT_359220 [Cylindrobasidium torrendii FP15055 ss-10]